MDSGASSHDVIVAGAGPVGLFLAAELRLGGASVLLLERAADAQSPLKVSPFGLRGLWLPAVEALQRRGLLAPLQHAVAGGSAPQGGQAHWAAPGVRRQPAGHFSGITFYRDRVDTARWPYQLPDAAGPGMPADMADIEAVLAAHALALGVEIRRGEAVEGVAGDAGGIQVQAGGRSHRARWLVGCDGGRSTVRKLAGIAFPGTDAECTGYSALVTLDDAAALPPGRHYTPGGMFTFQPPGTLVMADFDGGARHRAGGAVDAAHLEAVLRRVSGADVRVRALHLAATWSDAARQAARYRGGPGDRVLLAGDAAHIHSPLGGQGLNLGLGDAMSLGWRLAATVRGDAPHGLLGGYAAERMPVGAAVLDWSRAQVAAMRPDPGSHALRAVVAALADTTDGATWFAERLWAATATVALGSARAALHPLTGRSAPDFALLAGGRLSTLMAGGQGVLLDFAPGAPLAGLAGRWGARVRYHAGGAHDTLGLAAVLLRPDGVVAWACDGPAQAEAATRAGDRWFGIAGRV